MQPLFAYNALIWKNTITILTLILFVVFLVRGLYLFAVLGKHLLKSNQGFQYQQQARDTRNSFCLWPFWAKLPKFTQKWSLKKSYLRITREVSLRLLHGCKPKLCFPFAIWVGVQSIMEAFLTPQSLKHTIYGKKCIYRRYWYVHIFGSLRNKNMSKHFWSRPIVGAFKYAHHG